MSNKKSINDRMKENYELRFRHYLPRRIPVIIRLDGRAFHTFTRKAEKPYDHELNQLMVTTTHRLVSTIQGCVMGYTQSDEISLLLTDFNKLESEAWFDYNLNKLVSISASTVTAIFNTLAREMFEENYLTKMGSIYVTFDSRAFSVPKEEVRNYFIARQLDWERNSVQMLAQSMFSPKDLHKKKREDLIKMCETRGHHWEKLAPEWKLGTTVLKLVEDAVSISCPIFKDERKLFEKLLTPEEE